LAFGDEYGVKIDPFYTRTGCGTGNEQNYQTTGLDYNNAGGYQSVTKTLGRNPIPRAIANIDTGEFRGNYQNCHANSIFPSMMDCFFEPNMFRA